MRRFYPYLEDQTFDNVNIQAEKENFLASSTRFVNQKQYVRITLLNWAEEPLKEIQGEISSGSLTKDGSSAVRRTCSMTITFDDGDYNITDIDMDFSINKKIFVEIGIKNYTKEYRDYPILWFPQGIFFISSASIQNSATSNPTLNISIKDKMCGLNGDVGGKFPTAVILDTVDTQNADGKYVSTKVKIFDIIQELVHHYGGEPLENIVIEDVPLRIKKVVQWTGENPLYLKKENDTDTNYFYTASVSTPPASETQKWKQYAQNTDIGYVYTDFVYLEDLTFNIGDSVVSALEKIKQYLGNYEYFYDVFGVFHFREIKNYLNTTQAKYLTSDMDAKDYLVDVTTGKAIYSFTDKNDIISLTNSPKYENIKNDYIIQGYRQGTSDNTKINIRYHLVIDNKPMVGNTYYGVLLYQESDTNLVKLTFPNTIDNSSKLPEVGNFNIIYHTKDDNNFVYWDNDKYKDVVVLHYYAEASAEYTDKDGTHRIYEGKPKSDITTYDGYTTKDWRTELYIQGLLSKKLGTDNTRYYNNLDYNKLMTDSEYGWFGKIYRQSKIMKCDPDYYFEELDAYWPQVYDLQNQVFYGEVSDDLLTSRKKRYDDVEAALPALQETYNKAKTVLTSAQEVSDRMADKVKTEQVTLDNYNNQITKFQNNFDESLANYTNMGIEKSDEALVTLRSINTNLENTRELASIEEETLNSDKESLKNLQERTNLAQQAYDDAQDALEKATTERDSALSLYQLSQDQHAYPSQFLTDGNYFLDFIDPQTSGLGEYSVQNIGRRIDAVQDEDVNCLFQPEIPDIVWLEADSDDLADRRAECNNAGQPYSQLKDDLYQYLEIGGYKNGAYDRAKVELWTHTVYQQTVSLTVRPVFYLEPNSRVTINDTTTNTYGDYMTTSISLSFGPGNPMSVNCSECIQKM